MFVNRLGNLLTSATLICAVALALCWGLVLKGAAQAPSAADDAEEEMRILLTRFRTKRVTANTKRLAKPQLPRTTERPELVLQTGHAQGITGLAFSPNGQAFASGSPDGTVRIWDVANGRELRSLRVGTQTRALAFSPDGRILATGASDGQLRLWEVVSGRLLATLPGHNQRIEALTFSRDGQRLATAGFDGTVKLWDLAAQSTLHILRAYRGGAGAGAQSVAFSHDGRWLATGGADGAVKLWDAATGNELADFGRRANTPGDGHTAAVSSLAFSPDGATLIAGAENGALKLWQTAQGNPLPGARTLGSQMLALSFTPDGQKLCAVARNRTVKQFAAGSYNELLADVLRGAPAQYEAAAFSPDGEWLVSCDGSRSLELRRVAAGGEVRPVESTANPVHAVAFSPDGLWFAAGQQDTTVTLWDLVAGRAVARLPVTSGSVQTVAFAPDSARLAAGSLGGTIKIWNVAASSEQRNWRAHEGGVNGLSFTPDGRRLISCGADNLIKIWEVADERLPQTLTEHTDEVMGLSLHPDGTLLASASSDRTIKLWNLTTNGAARTLTGHEAEVLAVAFSPDGKRLASASADRTVKIWNVASGQVERTLTGFNDWVNSVAFSNPSSNPGGADELLAAASNDRTIKVWDAVMWQERFTLAEHTDQVSSVSFDPDNFWLVSGGEDGAVRVWDARKGESAAILGTLHQSRAPENEWLVATPDGLFDGSPTAWQRILWRFRQNTFDAAPVEVFFSEFYYPDLLGDLFAGKQPRAKQDITLHDRRQPRVELTIAGAPNASSINTAARSVTVRVQVSEMPPDKNNKQGSGAQDVRLFRNGLLVKAWRGDALKGQGQQTLEYQLPLVAGANQLTAYAFNRDSVKSVDAARLVNRQAEVQRGTLYLLAIGLDSYANTDFNLKYAVKDARSFITEVTARQQQIGRFAQIEVATLFDQEATKANLLAALRRLGGDVNAPVPAALAGLRRPQPEDAVIFYFAGHGAALDERFYLIPHDLGYSGRRKQLDERGVELVAARSVSDQELEPLLENIDARELIFVLDACESGQLLEAEDERRGPMNAKGLAQLAYEKGMNILAASQSYQAAIESSRLQHGYLTYALIEEGLKKFAADQRPRDGQVWLREWLDYATARVPGLHEMSVRERLLKHKKPAKQPSAPTAAADDAPTLDEAQRPRVFYRRELEKQPLIIAR